MINFGILGTSDITKRSLIGAAEGIPEVQILAIASRVKNRAAAFAEQHSIPESFGDYQEIIQHPSIHAVYIPLIPTLHAKWVIKAIEAGKHVLVEKPICMSGEEIAAIQSALDSNSAVLMEGMMSQYHNWQTDLKEILDKKPFGSLISLETISQYMLPEEDQSFRTKKNLGGGVFWEEGNVWLQLTQLCFGQDYIGQQVEAQWNQGVDMNFQCSLDFGNGRYSSVRCAYDQPYKAVHELRFETTTITVQNFWRPTFGAHKLRLNYASEDQTRKHIYPPENYYVNQLNHFLRLLNQKEAGKSELAQAFERVKITEQLYESVAVAQAT